MLKGLALMPYGQRLERLRRNCRAECPDRNLHGLLAAYYTVSVTGPSRNYPYHTTSIQPCCCACHQSRNAGEGRKGEQNRIGQSVLGSTSNLPTFSNSGAMPCCNTFGCTVPVPDYSPHKGPLLTQKIASCNALISLSLSNHQKGVSILSA